MVKITEEPQNVNKHYTINDLLKNNEIRWIIIFSLLYLVTRWIILNPQRAFWDSNEYAHRILSNNLIIAISSGHSPYHPLYLFFAYLLNVLLNNALLSLALISLIVGWGTVICFYFIGIKLYSNRSVTIISLFLFIFTPLWWISNTAIMTDSNSMFFYSLSMTFLVYSFGSQNQSFRTKFIGALVTGIVLGLAFVNATYIILLTFLSLPVSLIIYKKNKNEDIVKFGLMYASVIIGFVVTAVFLYGLVFYIGNHPFSAIGNRGTDLSLSLIYFLTSLLSLVKGVNWLIALFAIISIVVLLVHSPKKIIHDENFISLIWLIFSIPFVGFYAYVGLVGRLYFPDYIPMTLLAGSILFKGGNYFGEKIEALIKKFSSNNRLTKQHVSLGLVTAVVVLSSLIGFSMALPYSQAVPYTNYYANLNKIVQHNDIILCSKDDIPWIPNCILYWDFNQINTWLANGSRILVDNQLIYTNWWTYDGFTKNAIVDSQLLQRNIFSYIPGQVLQLFSSYQLVIKYVFSVKYSLWFYQLYPSNKTITSSDINPISVNSLGTTTINNSLTVNAGNTDKVLTGNTTPNSFVLVYSKTTSLFDFNRLWDPLNLVANLFYNEPLSITLTDKTGNYSVPLTASLYNSGNYYLKIFPAS